jgi:hypothetical protein
MTNYKACVEAGLRIESCTYIEGDRRDYAMNGFADYVIASEAERVLSKLSTERDKAIELLIKSLTGGIIKTQEVHSFLSELNSCSKPHPIHTDI